MRVLLADKLAAFVAPQLQDLGAEVFTEPALSGEALTARLAELDPHVLVVRSTKVQAPDFSAANALGLLIRAGAGVNTIDLEAASATGVYVTNCPGKNAAAVAELAIGHLLNLDRRIADNVAALREGRWDKKTFGAGRGLHGRKLAILGLGQIGEATARIARAMGMEVVAWSRSLTPERAAALGVGYAETPELAAEGADAISVHLAATPETRGRIGESVFAVMRRGGYVINTARAEVIDHAALEAAMADRELRAGLDVFPGEPSGKEGSFEDPLGRHERVYGTHHIGASTDEAEEAVGAEVVRIVAAFKRREPIPNCVNLARETSATHTLVVRHVDAVGVLAGVLGILSRAGHNVGEMQNILFSGGAAAVARIAVVGEPSEETLEEIRANERVFAAGVSAH
ncbi:MAG: NAD(P)-dependent oxidoreductase [Deltaproteobacteria bacterium]|nr:NAD(P)-dependent oxidoreductase [Deltaproteobacteria bacterium]